MSSPDLLAVARDLGWPAVSIGALEIAGEAGWRQALARYPPATPGECAQLLTELGPYILEATEGARARLAEWRAAGRKVQESPEELRQRIRAGVIFHGDEELLSCVVEGFATAPTPVREVLLPEVALVGVGWSTRGWYSPAIAPGATYLIVVSGGSRDFDDVTNTIFHELAHAWMSEPRPLVPARTAYGLANVRALAEAEQWAVIPAVDAKHAREERLAEALAWVWGLAR